jgi:hypothetical protein
LNINDKVITILKLIINYLKFVDEITEFNRFDYKFRTSKMKEITFFNENFKDKMLMDNHASVEIIKEILLRRLEILDVWFKFNSVNGIIVDSIITYKLL